MLTQQVIFSSVRQLPCLRWVNRTFGRRYGTAVIRDILKLHDRGIFQAMIPEAKAPDFAKKLSSPQEIYCGFDPTAESLHIGNLVAIIALIHCQRAGHQPIAVVGGATAHIGDPSGKTKDRDEISAESIEQNIIGLTENLERIFTNHAVYLWKDQRDLKDVKILNNRSWYTEMNVIDFLTKTGRYFRLNSMLNKHSVKSRLSSQAGMSFTEFTYQVFQAFDWLYLLQNHNCYIQIGGHDQYGNITAGMDLIDKALKERTFGLTLPLITSSQGHKVGKSEGNAVWLDPNKTTPYELYQYFLNVKDPDVGKYLKLFTFLPDADVDSILRNHQFEPEKRKAQKILAEKVLLLVHGETGLQEARRWTDAFFSDSPEPLLNLSDNEMQRLFHNAPTKDLPIQHDMTVLNLVMKSKTFDREVDAIRIIKAGGIYINHARVTEPDFLLTFGQHILPNNITLLRIGKKNYHIIRWKSLS
ncbi:tyrosine--tRNA ligase, mitochondrial-like [Mercenaria mercenaria]|uniref:tyrosine--tRNA ligase, mitochondrial-like n=1 Tax=Mercenaria mercenaria TaxID=6596 RepID=UPI00234F90A0|nr:tyrosine--tRNA ligase, mitochondrial-like [Mercenaria mercenaria]XP_053389496.1 tyrosine--tRNA ligase, mitochondrial-like [Mercenaria mercenaria]